MMPSYASSRNGKRARGKTKVGTGIWWLGLSVCGSMIGIERTNGCRVGMKSTPDLFWSEMCSTNGKGETVARDGND